MRIGELAKAAGTKAETIRYYEREGILPTADRSDNNYRDYSKEHLATLRFVRRARELGFSMAMVRELLALSDQDDKPCGEVDRLVKDQLGEIERKIADLQALHSELGQLIALCSGENIGDCKIVDSLTSRAAGASRDRLAAIGA